jgi:hypothetical protein
MRNRMRNRLYETYGRELMQKMFHPSNIDKFEAWGFDPIEA